MRKKLVKFFTKSKPNEATRIAIYYRAFEIARGQHDSQAEIIALGELLKSVDEYAVKKFHISADGILRMIRANNHNHQS